MCLGERSVRGGFTKLRDFGEFGEGYALYASLRGGVSPNDLGEGLFTIIIKTVSNSDSILSISYYCFRFHLLIYKFSIKLSIFVTQWTKQRVSCTKTITNPM